MNPNNHCGVNNQGDLALIPVLLFVYKRVRYLAETLASLKANNLSQLIVYCDGAKNGSDRKDVEQVREMVRAIDWCETRIVERDRNLGLGVSIRTGVSEVLSQYHAVIVFEDDIICVPGTYDYMCAALRRYAADGRVMSIAGFTHPAVRPPTNPDQPYFDGRFTCWGWGTWRRAWKGMNRSSRSLVLECRLRGRDVKRYGADIPWLAKRDRRSNTWAARFGMVHILRKGLCFHPPHSLTDHIGVDESTTSQGIAYQWALPPLEPCPPIPREWPEPCEHSESARLIQSKMGIPPSMWAEAWRAIMVFRWQIGAWVSRRRRS